MIATNQFTISVVNDGATGPQGPQGVSVTKVVTEYCKSSSSTALPSNPNWSETEPTLGANEYLWARQRSDKSDGTSSYGPAICSTNISDVKHDVDKANKSITDKVWQSDITTKINQYDNTTVSTIRDRVSTTETDISGIKTRVSDVENETDDLGTRMTSAETTIDQTANNVLIKATESDTTAAQGGQHLIQSLINVAPSGVTISADKVNIEGAAIFSSGRLSQTNLNNAYDSKGSAAAVQTNLDNLEIGGRNYYKNYSGNISISSGATATKDVSINGITGNNTATSGIKTLRLGKVITEQGYWTVSGYIKSENSFTLTGDICDVVSTLSLVTTTEYQYFSFTVNVTRAIDNTYHFVDFNIGANAGNFWFKDIKVEKGNKATSWTPAPEDQFASTVPCYYRKTTSGAPSAPSSTVGTSNNTDNTWTYVMPLPKKNCYFFTCEEYTNVGGTKSYSTVRALDSQTYTSKWVSSSDQTYIDGGSIYTHSITTSQLATDAIKSTNYLGGGSNSPYSSAGTFLDLSNGNFYTPNFGVQSLTGEAFINGEIIATSGSIGDDSGNYWEIGNTIDSQGNGSASIVGNGTAYIQDGDWQIHSGLSNYSNGSINTQWYTTPQGGGLQLTYPYYDGYYYDYGMTSPVLDTTSSRFYNQTVSQNFLYIRKHASTIPALESDWNYIFRVDKDGMIWINGQSLTQMIQSGVDGGAYVPISGGTITGNLTVTGTLTATASKANQLTHSISVNGKAFDGSADVTVGTIGAAYGGTGQTSLKAAGTAIIGALDTNTTTPVDNDYIATGSSTFYRKTMSKLWDYIKGKITNDHDNLDSLYVLKSGDTMTGSLTVEDSIYADSAQVGDLVVSGSGRFANGLYGDLTGNADTATKAAKVADSGNGTDTTFAYSKSGLTTASWIAAWSGYELRAISPANLLTTIGAVAKSGDTMTGTLTAPEFNLSGGVNNTTAGFRLTNNGTNMDMGWTWTGVQGAGACFTSSSHPSQAGIFDFFARAKNSSNQEVTKHLIGNISGVLTWDNRRVVTATNSTAVGGTSTPIYIDANGYAQVCTSISATSLSSAGTIQTNLSSTSAVTYTSGGNITAGVTGTLPIANGGTGATTAQNALWNIARSADPGDLDTAKRMGVFKISNTTTNAPWGTNSYWGVAVNITDDRAEGNNGTSGSTFQFAATTSSTGLWYRRVTNAIDWTSWVRLYTTDYKPSKSDVGLGNVTNNAQVKGLASGTTSGHLVTWGSDGYTIADSGIALAPSGNVRGIVSGVASDNNGKLVLTYADGTTSSPIDVEFVATQTSSVQKAEALNVNGTAIGGAEQPVYFNNQGKPQTANKIPKLNNATTGGTFYAPTGAGTSGQILKSSGGTPTWVDQSTLTAGAATKFSTNRSISLSGDVSGTATADGSSGWSITTTVADDSHNHTRDTIVPKLTKSYTGVIASANDDANCYLYCIKIVPETYNGQWEIKYRVYADMDGIADSNGNGKEESIVYVSGMRNTYAAYRTWNNITHTSYRPYYYHNFRFVNEANISYGHICGISLRNAYNPNNATYKRNVTFEILESKNCTVSFFDSPLIYDNVPNTGNYSGVTNFDATTQGNTMSGDRNDPNYEQKEYWASRTAYKFCGRYQLLVTRPDGQVFPVNTTDNNITTTKTYDTSAEFDPFGQIFYHYSSGTTAANGNIGDNRLFNKFRMDLRYAFNVGGANTTSLITSRKPFYLVATPQTNGMAKIHSSGFSQDLPTSDDGLIYIYLGTVFEDANPYRLNLTINHPVYWYKDGAVIPYIYRAEIANSISWSGITDKPINLKSYSGSLATGGWAQLNGKAYSPSIAIAYNSAAAPWNSSNYSASMVFGCQDTRGLIDLAYGTPTVTFGGGNFRDSTDDNPRWHFKISGTSEQSYTLPTTSKTLAATDGSNASGTWGISISGTAAKATADGSGNTITSTYVNLTGTQTISGAKTFSAMPLSSAGICVNSGGSGTAGGISLWSDKNVDQYGLALRTTANGGKHGFVQGDYATYSYMYAGSAGAQLTRGWIFKDSVRNQGVASISGAGNAVFDGSVTVGGNATNTSGCRQEFDSTLNCLNFIFN